MKNFNPMLDDFRKEMETALQALESGNKGKARVCARRAAGIIVAIYLQENGMENPELNAYERLKLFANMDQVPDELRRIAAHFIQPVDTEFNLPEGIDLISDAQILAKRLIGDEWL